MCRTLTVEWSHFDSKTVQPVDTNFLSQEEVYQSGFPNGDTDDQVLIFKPQESLCDTFISKVYRGSLSIGNTKFPSAVVKFCTSYRRFGRQEAAIYRLPGVQEIQHMVVPTCYGYFIGYGRFGEIGCLVLEGVGERLQLSAKCGIEVSSAICRLHKAGLTHNAIPTNVMKAPDGRIVLISLGAVEQGHVCVAQDMMEIEYGFAPSFKKFPCRELYNLLRQMGVWIPPAFPCYESWVSSEAYALPTRTQDITLRIKKLAKLAPPGTSGASAMLDATTAIAEYLKSHRRELYAQDKQLLLEYISHYTRLVHAERSRMWKEGTYQRPGYVGPDRQKTPKATTISLPS